MNLVLIFILTLMVKTSPENTGSFTIDFGDNRTVEFTKQSDGSWKGIELPDQQIGLFSIDSTTLKIGVGDRQQEIELARILEVSDETDWVNMTTHTVGRTCFHITRKDGELIVELADIENVGDVIGNFHVTWEVTTEAEQVAAGNDR